MKYTELNGVFVNYVHTKKQPNDFMCKPFYIEEHRIYPPNIKDLVEPEYPDGLVITDDLLISITDDENTKTTN